MTKQLPIIGGNRSIKASVTASTSLLGRGLVAIQNGKLSDSAKYTEEDLLTALSRVMYAVFRLGYLPFQDVIKRVVSLMSGHATLHNKVDKISIRQWKAVYNGTAEYFDGTDSEDTVNSMPDEDVKSIVQNIDRNFKQELTFDEEIYEKAKPLFLDAIKHLDDAAKDIEAAMLTVIDMVLDKSGPSVVSAMKPYIVKFIDEINSSEISKQLIVENTIQHKETNIGISLSNLDAQYREARDIYNRITDYGDHNDFDADLLPNQRELLENPQLLQLQPFFFKLQQLAAVFIVFQQLADQDYGKAYFPLANMYSGMQGIRTNSEKSDYYEYLAFSWCFSNQILSDPEIWCDLGNMYLYGFCATQGNYETDDEEAFICYEKSAEQNDTRGLYYLGEMHMNGYYVAQDGKNSVYWYRKAAEQCDAEAQFKLGRNIQLGRGIEQNDKQAVFWYRNAAEQGHSTAQERLGWMYEYGHGVEQDDKQAVFWYRRAAEQNHTKAQDALANLGIHWKYSLEKY